jgi:transketolase
MIIVAPADNYETVAATKLAAESDVPVYLRFGKKAMEDLSAEASSVPFSFGKGRVLQHGEDVAIIANGETVLPALKAAAVLQEKGIYATVVSMHTIKPLDEELLETLAETCKAIVTVEEHSVHGGLGEACASFLLQRGYTKPFKIMGFPDEYTVTGSQQEIFAHYGISAIGIATVVEKMIAS